MNFNVFKNELYLYLGEHGAELDYVVGMLFNDLTNRLKGNASDIQLSDAAITGITVGWNYFDAVYNFMFASSLFADRSKYRYQQNVIKAVINIINGVQLFVLTYNKPLNNALGLKGDTALAGVSFALGTALDLLCAAMDFYNARKEYYLMGWLDEQVKALLYAKKNELETGELKKNIRARCKSNIAKGEVSPPELMTFFNNKIPETPENSLLIIELTHNLSEVKYKHRERDQDIAYDLQTVYRAMRTFIVMKGLSMIGMILIAIAGFTESSSTNYPVILTLGLAATTLVASYYFICNAEKVADKVGGWLPRFFTPDASFRVAVASEAAIIELQSTEHLSV